MKHERSLQHQTRRIEREKQDKILLVEQGVRPEKVRDTHMLFDGECFCIRYKGEWKVVGRVIEETNETPQENP